MYVSTWAGARVCVKSGSRGQWETAVRVVDCEGYDHSALIRTLFQFCPTPPQPTDRWALGLVSELSPLPLSFFVSFLFIKPPVQMDGSDRRGGSVCGDPAVMGNRWAGVSIIWHFLSGKSTCSACRRCNTVRVSDDLNSAPCVHKPEFVCVWGSMFLLGPLHFICRLCVCVCVKGKSWV